MSWVLIIKHDLNVRPDVVVGGFHTIEDAERAGDLATAWRTSHDWDTYGDCIGYTVVPIGSVEPTKSIHCLIERGENNRLYRSKSHYNAETLTMVSSGNEEGRGDGTGGSRDIGASRA